MDGMHHRRDLTPLGFALRLFIGTAPVANAADLLGVYVGGAVGQARIDTGNLQAATVAGAFNFGTFNENHTAYKLIGGVRAISLIGAEIEYMDFGHPGKSFSLAGVTTSADVKMSGTAAYGMLYLPVPVVNVYVKAGLARLQATSNVSVILPGVGTCPVSVPNCALFSQRNSATNTSFAAGAGAQVKLGAWALRAEYERFSAAGGNPALTSLAVAWTFL